MFKSKLKMECEIDLAHTQSNLQQTLDIYNQLDVKMLKYGCEIRIRGPSGADVDYYEFVVTYNDLVEENSVGKLIGLKLKNDRVQLPSGLKYFSRNYRLNGIGIAVPADWIMQYLYKEAECQPEVENIQQQLTLNEDPKKINETGAIPKPNNHSCNSEKLGNNSCGSVLPPSISSDLINLSYNTYGMIRRECIAIEVPGLDDNIGDLLKPGTLIEILPYSRAEICHFKIHDFTNWLEKYKVTIYKCSKDDYIAVAKELWQYLVALKNDVGRIKLVQNVYRRTFDMGTLKVSREIRIRRPPGADESYYEFIVIYNGIMEEEGIGHFIVLQLKNAQVLSIKDLNYLGQNGRSGNTTIVVTAYWIMSNIYKEDECQMVPPGTLAIENILPVDHGGPSKVIENDSESVRWPSTLTVEPNQISETGARAEKHYRSSEFNTGTKQIDMPTNKVDFEVTQTNSRCIRQTSTPTENLNIISETGTISKPRRLSPDIKYDANYANQTNYATELDLISNADGSVKNAEMTKCDLCDKIVEIGSGIILRECLHSFCLQCICYHVKQNSNNSSIRCPYIKEYECKSDLWDVEIKDLGGDIVYNIILDNRLREFLVNEPTNSRKCVNENCKNTWANPSPQKAHTNLEKCPECNNNNNCINNMKAVNFEKCVTCSNQPDVHLTRCGHSFCHKCIRQLMAHQVIDPSKMYINCIQCNEHITEKDISLYGSVEIFSLLKSKIDSARVIPNPLVNISIEDWPVKCVSCEIQILINSCVILAGCRDIYCRACFKKLIDAQLRNSQILECPNCSKCLEQFEVDEIMRITVDVPKNIINLVECILCEAKFEQSLVQQCLKCANIICLNCAYLMISRQMAQNRIPFCTLCQTLLVESEIARIRSTLRPEALTEQIQLGSVVIPEADNCPICIKQFSQRIDLKNCGHGFCCCCIAINITIQQTKGSIPTCPLCRKPISADEVAVIIESASFSNSDTLQCKSRKNNKLLLM